MKQFYLIILFEGIALLSYAQSMNIRFIDSQGEPIPAVSVENLHTGHHVHSNREGKTTLYYHSVSDTLLVHHISYDEEYYTIAELQDLSEVVLLEKVRHISAITIPKEVKSIHVVADFDLSRNPVNSSQEILPVVPGLFIGQHGGGGKAEQIFLRGFDIDHGTDLSISVDGMPVNMVSHAHGQGYSDLHFLIPETVEEIGFGKGTYYAEKGNFATAGYVDLYSADKLRKERIKVEIGDFNTIRTVGLFNLMSAHDQSAYAAAEVYLTDGWFISPQNFSRVNLFAKSIVKDDDGGKLSLQASYFRSKWDASGQIPWRAVNDRTIGRFGAIDDTEGGETSRVNVIANVRKYFDDDTYVQSKAFFTHYNFELYSNFTFFLRDSVNGDQIKQQESRNMLGAESVLKRRYIIGKGSVNLSGGAGFRYDNINDNALFYTKDRKEVLDTVQLGNIDETNVYGFLNAEVNFGKWLVNPAVRVDYFKFSYQDQLSSIYSSPSNKRVFVSPKLNVIFQQSDQLQLFLKTGVGFHSNDTRVVVAEQAKKILPAAYGADLGTLWKTTDKLFVNLAFWTLYLEQEFVYVGDEGVVEPSGETVRTGIDIGARYEVTNGLFLNNDITITKARSIKAAEGEDYVPLAPLFTNTGGITYNGIRGISGGLRYRWLGDRPANEDNSIEASGYFVMDMNLNYSFKHWTTGIEVYNLLNTSWEETQFATESRLKGEANSVEEIHFTPGAPFFIKGQVTVKF